MYDKKIEKTGFTGKTLDLSGGNKRKRNHSMRRSLDKVGKTSPSSMSRHIADYA